MTREEAKKTLQDMWECLFNEMTTHTFEDLKEHGMLDNYSTAFDMAISALKGGEWIPINDIEDIPKSGSYWVTRNYVFDTIVEKIRWSDAWRCWVDEDDDSVMSKESASLITAYIPYVVPEPYKKGE